MVSRPDDDRDWFIEGFLDGGSTLRRYPVRPFPFVIGRRPELDLPLDDPSVSGTHAALDMVGGRLVIRDLESRNGTFVNRSRVEGSCPLREGDVIQVGGVELRLASRRARGALDQTMTLAMSGLGLGRGPLTGGRAMRRLLDEHAVVPHFQPLVTLQDGSRMGFEVLGRGRYDGLPVSPHELFRIAGTVGLEAHLSRLFRAEGVRAGGRLSGPPNLFVNTHPVEMDDESLLPSLADLRRQFPALPITLEIHEAAVTDLDRIRSLRDRLREMGVQLAYDDFGAGQARLLELVEVTPDVLKFDIALVRDIHRASASRRRLLQSLVRMVVDLGVPCLAEGVECVEEAEVCREVGFTYAQGFHFGRPAPAETWLAA